MQLIELNEIFIETGTYVGETLSSVKTEFIKLISIEITDNYYNYSLNKFSGDNNIELIKGDSLYVLPKLATRYDNSKIVFFLDAHCSAGDTGKNDLDVPLIEELKIIEQLFNNNLLIIIDDADLFDKIYPELTWAGINEVNVLKVFKNRAFNYFYVKDIRSNDKKKLIIELNEKGINNW